MTEHKENVTIGLRLASMLVDHFAMTFIIMIIVMPGFAVSMLNTFNIDHEPSSIKMGNMFFLVALGFSAYFNKDIFNGRSPAKRILKMQVIDNKTHQVASPVKCLVRNLTIPIWPIEVIFVFIDPKRRLGDKIAGTRIEYVESPEKVKINWRRIFAPLLIAIGFSTLISLPFIILSHSLSVRKVDFIATSLNEQESKNANQIFETELNGLIKKADFKVYDKVTNDDRKYVAGILYFNNKADYNNFETSENEIAKLLAVRFPLKNHICFLKFVYQQSGSISTTQKLYDERKPNR
jgi:uncharacterized RDD family membrane protein YckC